MGCSGNCGSCGGCAKQLYLTEEEITVLQTLGQVCFLPVARKVNDMTPVYLEADAPENASLVLQVLEKKGLIDIDYKTPLKGFDMSVYAGFPVHGAIALTARGQTVLDMLEIQGIDESGSPDRQCTTNLRD